MFNRKGFTLIELLIVVVIIGILAAIAIPKFAATKDKAKLASVKTDVRNMMTAQEAYFSDYATYGTFAQLQTGCGRRHQIGVRDGRDLLAIDLQGAKGPSALKLFQIRGRLVFRLRALTQPHQKEGRNENAGNHGEFLATGSGNGMIIDERYRQRQGGFQPTKVLLTANFDRSKAYGVLGNHLDIE